MKRMSWLGLALALATPAASAAVSGAIYTSLSDGSEVNFNIYASKDDVYLNGGPGKGAGSNAPGLRVDGVADGVYVFMVTSPDGRMLSTDIAACRRVQVTGGLVVGIAAPDPLDPTTVCAAPNKLHLNGIAQPGGATAVQLMPYDDTPNPGGEYKAWLTPAVKYVCPFNVVSCEFGRNGFVNSESKTDNFKVNSFAHEIDARFWDPAGNILDGRMVTWFDTLGASNVKWSYYEPQRVIMHEAHIEAPELGTHYVSIPNQLGCTVGSVYVAGVKTRSNGPQTVAVRITKGMLNKGTFTVFIDVYCSAS